MKVTKLSIALTVSACLVVLVVIGARTLKPANQPVVIGPTARPAKIDQRIERAQQMIRLMPGKSEGYNQLASAYMQKARETTDFSYNALADETITRSLGVETDNYDALKLRAKLQLTYHRFSEALETTHKARRFRTDDHDVWGQITDALVELGDYPGAVEAAQKMVDLRPDSSAYARVSYLRSLHGDVDGAIQAMAVAVQTANPNDREGLAWCRVQLGNELLNAGKHQAAEQQFDEALRTFEDHHLALEGKARVRITNGDLQSAVVIYERELAKGPAADAAQALGELYTALGQSDRAKHYYAQFEILERENAKLEKSWRHMLNYWLDNDLNLAESLKLASQEYEARKDIFTCDSLAWALFKNGRIAEARKVMDEALRTGSKDARINFHAGLILRALNLNKKAASHLELATAINAGFDPTQAQTATRILNELQ
jgi:tetratricopeptide (TPR) repeat protein